MAGKIYRQKILKFGEDFDQYMDRFNEIITSDKEIINSVQENIKKKVLKNGLFTHAIRELIKNYVDANWDEYIKHKKGNNGNNTDSV